MPRPSLNQLAAGLGLCALLVGSSGVAQLPAAILSAAPLSGAFTHAVRTCACGCRRPSCVMCRRGVRLGRVGQHHMPGECHGGSAAQRRVSARPLRWGRTGVVPRTRLRLRAAATGSMASTSTSTSTRSAPVTHMRGRCAPSVHAPLALAVPCRRYATHTQDAPAPQSTNSRDRAACALSRCTIAAPTPSVLMLVARGRVACSSCAAVRRVSLAQAAAVARPRRRARRYRLRRAPRAHPCRTLAAGRQLRAARCEYSEYSGSA